MKIQYSERTYYNLAEILIIASWIILVFNIVIDMIVPENLEVKIYIVSGCTALTLFAQYISCKTISYAAGFRMYFDYKMYNWENDEYNGFTEEELFEKSNIIVKIRKKDSKIRISNNGEQKSHGVRDWYDNIINLKDGNELINICQQQNIWWTSKMKSVQKYVLWGLRWCFYCY